MITIINYGSGNIRAIANIYDDLKIPYKIASKPEEIIDSEKIILPGVGSYDETINMLDKLGFRSILDNEVLIKKTPVLGICVGMQILGNNSDEGKAKGLGWIDGNVKLIDKSLLNQKPYIPHLGWNSIKLEKKTDLFNEIDLKNGFYFLHSYYFECKDNNNQLSTTFYGKEFSSSIMKDNVFGVQFHPEKSHNNGIQLLKNFALIKC
jgi:glutamine amidotransferase